MAAKTKEIPSDLLPLNHFARTDTLSISYVTSSKFGFHIFTFSEFLPITGCCY